MNKLIISKTENKWFAILKEKVITNKSKKSRLNDEFHWKNVDSVNSESFGGLMIEIGNKNWVDLINKNE